MKQYSLFLVATFCLFLSSCHRPVAYFQRTPHPEATRLLVEKRPVPIADIVPEVDSVVEQPTTDAPAFVSEPVASLKNEVDSRLRIEQRMQRVERVLATEKETTTQQPDPRPKPKNQLRLGNRIRQSLGIPLRKELNWWQRISWKLKASVIVILVAVVFAILGITTLAIIFGLLGAFLMISGLKRSFKVKRPWF
ncbi:hypothetical protein [Spirosoma aerolatum]|uniref:hypothetical protein n=1 Tax=Spirosoma aerolatum TaxID=1211326 RepID=UPI0009AE14C6|nr:hypothetical protein [Spirosoma aerolatum]